ncbi:MAG: hypothetical protein M4579_002513 [Chaenotheca gracillima]|nr:MAG: hypothetical protein M4579_002513 [Chaenotheca gracillima]
MSQDKIVEGVLGIHKPQGITSAQVLRDLQQHFKTSALFTPWLERERERVNQQSQPGRKWRRNKRSSEVKIGHGGTLDPLATGVLVAGIGKGTKELGSFLGCTKSYEAVVLFGAATDSYDRLGKVLSRAPHEHLTRTKVEEALAQFRGKIMQRPPVFSALRVQGKHLYEYAREGKEVPEKIEERPVEVMSLELVDWMEGGTHKHQLPTEEAPGDEKKFAEKLLHIETSETPTEVANSGKPRGVKRQLDADAEAEAEAETAASTAETPSTKRPRHPSDVEQPLMSGGLASHAASTEDQVSLSEAPVLSNASSDVPAAPTPADTQDSSLSPSQPQPPAAILRITSGSGFYVRSLCHDLGVSLGSLAIMSELIRTRQGDFELGKNVLEYDDLEKGEEIWGPKVEALLREGGEAGES